jgi:hypothetical protein
LKESKAEEAEEDDLGDEDDTRRIDRNKLRPDKDDLKLEEDDSKPTFKVSIKNDGNEADDEDDNSWSEDDAWK